jgi:dTMP kinase
VPITVSRARLDRSQAQGRELDKFETEADGFFQRVRAAYLDRAREHPERFRVIDSTRPVDDVRRQIDIGLADLGIA